MPGSTTPAWSARQVLLACRVLAGFCRPKGAAMQANLDHRALYRLPWSFSDNVIAWLEPTAKCNLACEGCYRANLDQHKTLEQVRADLETFKRYRNFDGVSIAGGDPLTHPEVAEIVRMVARDGYKPV